MMGMMGGKGKGGMMGMMGGKGKGKGKGYRSLAEGSSEDEQIESTGPL
jgi:hypothetical protein